MSLLVANVQRAGAYEYEETPSEYVDEYATPEVHTDTKWEDATASASPDEATATSSCDVHTYSRVTTEDSAASYAQAYGGHRRDWVWNGPPGTAPGGRLTWYQDVLGSDAPQAAHSCPLRCQPQMTRF